MTGRAKILVTATGLKTKFYTIVSLLSQKELPNEFERGIKQFSILITRMVIVMTVFVSSMARPLYLFHPRQWLAV